MPKGGAIPTKQRELVKVRDHHQCLRCGGQGSAWHHRRKRDVGGPHRHCTCNGVWLCLTCHRYAHSFKTAAASEGYIVSSFTTEPGTIAVQTRHGELYLSCEGSYQDSNDKESNDGNESRTGAGSSLAHPQAGDQQGQP